MEKYIAVNVSNNLVTDRMYDTPEEAEEHASHIKAYGKWGIIPITIEDD